VPHRDLLRRAQIVEPDRFSEPADPARLDVDDAARAGIDGFAGDADGLDRFVEADRRAQPALQRRVVGDIVVIERCSIIIRSNASSAAR